MQTTIKAIALINKFAGKALQRALNMQAVGAPARFDRVANFQQVISMIAGGHFEVKEEGAGFLLTNRTTCAEHFIYNNKKINEVAKEIVSLLK